MEEAGEPEAAHRPKVTGTLGQCRDTVVVDHRQLLKEYRSTHPVEVDACLEPLILALNRRGIETISSCCGHGLRQGWVMLADRTVIPLWKCADGRVR